LEIMLKASSLPISDFIYELPESRIARYPLPDRSASKLLLYRKGKIVHSEFSMLEEHLPQDSWLVFNNTKVIQARLDFHKESGARIEIFCLEPVEPADYEQAFKAENQATWHCLVGNVKKWKSGPVLLHIPFNGSHVLLKARLLERLADGFLVQFRWNPSGITFGELLERTGSTPIPPYLKRKAEGSDRERYQTVYSRNKGSVAAPTAGLHFTRELLDRLEHAKVPMYNITLHVGAGTFVPVKEKNAREHSMHSEKVVVSRGFLEQWMQRPDGLIAVGTTSTRSMESLYWLGLKLMGQAGSHSDSLELMQWDHEKLPEDIPLKDSISSLLEYCRLQQLEELHFSTQLMITPGYRFRTIRGLITNFHLPGSTLLLLIAAWIGADWRRVYDYALRENFRFLSYGDSSLLIP
jgi:S-adenosylmethionine:tRNA ribosyltransferase-isomerase